MNHRKKTSASDEPGISRISRFLKLRMRSRRAPAKPAARHTTHRGRQDANRFKRLPDPIHPRDMSISYETRPVRDPEGGRDTDRDFVIRYGDDMGDG